VTASQLPVSSLFLAYRAEITHSAIYLSLYDNIIVDNVKIVSYHANIFGERCNMRKILEACPTCGGDFAVTELTCTVCETVVRSRYNPCPFCSLSPEDLGFMLVFVKNRGNVKDMERELGVSYWTIRGRLNEVINAMGFVVPDEVEDGPGDEAGADEDEPEPTSPADRAISAARREILDQLKRGELTAGEAAERLAQFR
jgi:hypothetical protein